jgi:hypothetical protein
MSSAGFPNCKFVGGTVERNATEESDPCVNGTLPGGTGQTITFSNSVSYYTGALRLVINCGASTACAFTVTDRPSCGD